MLDDEFDELPLAQMHRLGGEALAASIVALVRSVAPVRVETIASAAAAGSWPDAFRAAHSLHPLAAQVGARALQRLALEAESMAAAQDEAGLRRLLPELSLACVQACDYLARAVSKSR